MNGDTILYKQSKPYNYMTDAYKKCIEAMKMPVKEQEPLAPYSTYKVGGPADLFVEARVQRRYRSGGPSGKNDLESAHFCFRGRSNILIGDKGFRGL
jgi:hypothetical protein